MTVKDDRPTSHGGSIYLVKRRQKKCFFEDEDDLTDKSETSKVEEVSLDDDSGDYDIWGFSDNNDTM